MTRNYDRTANSMRKLCPNLQDEGGLETVLEIPIPEEMFNNMGTTAANRWQNMRNLMKKPLSASRNDFIFLLKLVGSPFIPCQAQQDHAVTLPVRDGTMEAATAKYIVQQYMAATGGQAALNYISSMYAVGQVSIAISESAENGDALSSRRSCCEVGGFVLWQKNPDLWYLELVVSGHNVSAGSDGKVAWSQSSASPAVHMKGPPRPNRRFFQGLDPRSTGNLFLNAVCIGEKKIGDEECFTLKLDVPPETLKAQNTPNTVIVHHNIWGHFSQRSGLLILFEDSKMVSMDIGGDIVFYEISMESHMEDYKNVDGIKIAHSGRTCSTICRYGNETEKPSRVSKTCKVDETWKIEEIDFNICGLSIDSFLPPATATKEQYQE